MARSLRFVKEGILLFAFFFLLILIAAKLDQEADEVVRGPFRVVDGDTLAVGGERLRLQGIDAPEIDQACEDDRGQSWTCGEEARRLLVMLVAGGQVECLGRDRDRYHRLLVRCRAGAVNINAEMVRRGLAVASGRYADEQVVARRERQGVWSGRFENPRDFRASSGVRDDPNLVLSLMARLRQWGGGE